MKRFAVVSGAILTVMVLASLAACSGGIFLDPGHDASGFTGGGEGRGSGSGDGANSGGNSFAGVWESDTSGETLTLYTDLKGLYGYYDSGQWASDPLTYTYSGNTITITMDGKSATGTIVNGKLHFINDTWTKK
ncbi:MAG: hypothetical protein LBL56_02210 [Treponema sp.]|jgi:hypothetical protein|nr:hypothetical protein [Treponema sp.]